MAFQIPYQVTHITDAEKGGKYHCLGCNKDMVARRGNRKRHHFAHKAEHGECNPDNALHETAKAAICQGFLTAQEDSEPYLLQFPCERCGKAISTNIAVSGAGIATERTAVDGTRSDLVATKEDGKSPRVIIEIVVYHDLEAETASRYRESGVPVIKVKPTWETVDEMRKKTLADDTLNISQQKCRPCREWTEYIEKKLRAAITPKEEDDIELVPITRDKYDARLRWDTRRQVNENAQRLARIGFRQQPSRPTLFRIKIEEWTIYGDLDSTDVVRIWEADCSPGLYAFPEHPKPPKCRECVLEIVRTILEENGIEARRYFLDSEAHNHRWWSEEC